MSLETNSTIEHVLKSLFNLYGDDVLHVVLYCHAKFSIDYFLAQSEEELMKHEFVRDKGAVLLLQSHELGALKQLKDFRMQLVSENSTRDANFDCASITKKSCDQFRIGNSYHFSTTHAGQQHPNF